MKIGIIGSSGFIGSNLSLFLEKNTNYKIFFKTHCVNFNTNINL